MIKEIREYYGVPQNILAGCLRVNRSTMSMAEIRRRELPSRPNLALIRLHLAMLREHKKVADKILEKELSDQENKLNKLIESRISENQYQTMRLSRKLEKLIAGQARSIKVLASLQSLKAQGHPDDEMLLKVFEDRARQLQSKTSSDKRFLLEMQLRGLQDELAYLQERIK